MNQVAKIEEHKPRRSLIETMATKVSMEPALFERTVRSTVMPQQHTNEQFAALMLVAHEYGLNPIVKEIYAFPAKGGGIVPIVSIDGWVNLVNSHPKCNGFTFEWEHDDKGQLVSCTCKMHRKDRDHPVEVTEYLSECRRNTEPWKMAHRMLRHKTMIQAARYAFGFSGIYDEDEGAKIAEMRDVTPVSMAPPPPPPAPPTDTAPSEQAADGESPAEPEEAAEQETPKEIFERAKRYFSNCLTIEDLDTVWDTHFANLDLGSDDEAHLLSLYENAEAHINGKVVMA